MKVLVDHSNLARICWYPAKVAATENPGLDAQDILRRNLDLKLTTVEDAIGFQRDRYVFCLDSRAQWKFDLFPAYKANRPPQEFDPRPVSQEYLMSLGYSFVMAEGQEADDVIAALATQAGDDPVTIISADRDLWQLLTRPNVAIWSPSLGRYVQPEDVIAAFRVGPQHLRLAKALWGDSGDNVPNCAPRMQKQLVPLIQMSDGTIENLLALVPCKVNAKCEALVQENLNQILLNWELVGLNAEVPVTQVLPSNV